MKEELEQTVKVLTEATAAIRADYLARYTELELASLVEDRKGLAAVGMDREIYCPYPSGRLNRTAYRQAEAKRDRVSLSFKSTVGCRSMRDPDIVVEKEDAEVRLRARAKQEADALVDSYLYKLAGKIGKEIVSATTNGRIWEWAKLTVICKDGEVQVWKTQCIINRSVYNKLFNQWPTRRES